MEGLIKTGAIGREPGNIRCADKFVGGKIFRSSTHLRRITKNSSYNNRTFRVVDSTECNQSFLIKLLK